MKKEIDEMASYTSEDADAVSTRTTTPWTTSRWPMSRDVVQ